MIEYVRGDIFTADAEALVNPVGTDGVMAKGLSAQFKRAYPANYTTYHAACGEGDVVVGRMLVVETERESPRYIVNFPTKSDTRSASRLEYIEAGLQDLVHIVRTHEIRSIAIPGLGAGLGGLSWHEVRPRIESALAAIPDVHAYVYEPLPD